jgi:hypothetical protein
MPIGARRTKPLSLGRMLTAAAIEMRAQRGDRQGVGEARAAAAGALAEGRQDNLAFGAREGGRQRGVFGRGRARREVDVERDRGGAGAAQLVDHAGVAAARPRPAVDRGDAAAVDLDDVQVTAGGGAAQAPGEIGNGALDAGAEAGHAGDHRERDRARERPRAPVAQARLEDGHRLSRRAQA